MATTTSTQTKQANGKQYGFKPGNSLVTAAKAKRVIDPAFPLQPVDKQDDTLAQASRNNALALAQTITQQIQRGRKIDHQAIKNLAIAFGICKQRGEQAAPAKFNMVINLFGSLPNRDMQASVSDAPIDIVALPDSGVTLPTEPSENASHNEDTPVPACDSSVIHKSDEVYHNQHYPTLPAQVIDKPHDMKSEGSVESDMLTRDEATGTLGSGGAGAGAAAGKPTDTVS